MCIALADLIKWKVIIKNMPADVTLRKGIRQLQKMQSKPNTKLSADWTEMAKHETTNFRRKEMNRKKLMTLKW